MKNIQFIKVIIVLNLFVLVGCLPLGEDADINRYVSPSQSMKSMEHHKKEEPTDSLHWKKQEFIWKYINHPINQWIKDYGEPTRKDNSNYGYEWWIYEQKEDYLQIAVKNEQVVSFYTASPQLKTDPLKIGMSKDEIEQHVTLLNEVEFDHLKFKLNEKDFEERPIIRLAEDVFAQLYIDTFTDKLAGLRIMNKEVFELLRPYELYYYGELIEVPEQQEESKRKIEQGIEQQILAITNQIRVAHDKRQLKWDDMSHKAAKGHSKDMFNQNYFSHFRPNGEGLKERLAEANAKYLSAGENIAANYVDGPDVVHGWLNSEGHRDALLHDSYTHIGVGVYDKYYTQNFLEKLD